MQARRSDVTQYQTGTGSPRILWIASWAVLLTRCIFNACSKAGKALAAAQPISRRMNQHGLIEPALYRPPMSAAGPALLY